MPTSVHIPALLLTAIDRRARRLKISRNRLILSALERELAAGSEWSPGFFDQLREVDPALEAAVDDLTAAIRIGRRSKAPPQL